MAKTQTGCRSWVGFGLQVLALAVAASLGFVVAMQPQTAAADGLLPTTIAVPGLTTVQLPPISLPAVTTTAHPASTTTTTAAATPTTTTAATAPQATANVDPARAPTTPGPATASAASVLAKVAESAIAGALRLPDGSTSIPVTSVKAPDRLLLTVIIAPVATAARPFTAGVRVSDTQGHRVRGAYVAIRSVPGGLLSPIAQKRSATNGSAAFVVRARPKALRTSTRLWLLVAATDPARLKSVAVSRKLSVPTSSRGR